MNDSYYKSNLAKKSYAAFPSEEETEKQLSLIFDPQICPECGEDHSFKNRFENVKANMDNFPNCIRNNVSGMNFCLIRRK